MKCNAEYRLRIEWEYNTREATEKKKEVIVGVHQGGNRKKRKFIRTDQDIGKGKDSILDMTRHCEI